MSTVNLPAFRCAVSLNNTGVALLEKQSYKKALATLQDAVSMMRNVYDEGDDSARTQAVFDRIQASLQRASQRFAKPKPFANVTTMKESLQSIPDTASTLTSLPLKHAKMMPIRIESFLQEYMELDSPRDINYECACACAMHNCAIALFCVSKMETNERSKAESLANQALTIMLFCHSILRNARELIVLQPQTRKIIMLDIVITKATAEICFALNRKFEALRYKEQLAQLKADFDSIHISDSCWISHVAAAA